MLRASYILGARMWF